jgi:hypothetical protein
MIFSRKFRFVLIGFGLLLCIAFAAFRFQNTEYTLQIARLKYNGGGDWYSSRSALSNLAKYCNKNIQTAIDPSESQTDVGSSDIFNYPFIFLTGHGNIVFSDAEAINLRNYLEAGGFLHICDNYGLDKYIRPAMKKVFPELSFVELPFSHPVYHEVYDFPNGLVKVHEHDGKPPQGFGLIYKGRLVCFYDYECDLGNGWEDAEVYNDPEPVRTKALQMGVNLVHYAFNH